MPELISADKPYKPQIDQLTWLVVFAAFLAFFAAYGIGANDVANAYATSVGAKSLTIKQAVVLAAIFEVLLVTIDNCGCIRTHDRVRSWSSARRRVCACVARMYAPASACNNFGNSHMPCRLRVRCAFLFRSSRDQFLGAVTMGSSVAKTIRKGIVHADCFENNPGLLMWGMTCVILVSSAARCARGSDLFVLFLFVSVGFAYFDARCNCIAQSRQATGLWLLLASYLEMPVSTTHSCVGGVIGMTLMSRNSDCVVWNVEGIECSFDTFPCAKGVLSIVISWVLSPVASGIMAAFLYFVTYHAVLKNPENAFLRAKIFFPLIVAFTMMINTIFFLLKGSKGKAEDLGTDDIVSAAKEGDLWPAFRVGFIVFAVTGVLTALITPTLAGRIPAEEPADAEVEVTAVSKAESGTGVISAVEGEIANAEVDTVLKTDSSASAIHAHVHRHDWRCEEMFKYVQVFTAIVDSYSHGANDVANAMGPFSAVYMTYKYGEVVKKQDLEGDMYWILAIGGLGIVVGLATYGYKIIAAIGVKLTAITPSRGYCIELGAAFVIIYGTSKGWPLSTTHCQVGATVGVGLFEGAAGVNKWVLFKCCIGWVITLVVVGLTTALLVGPNPDQFGVPNEFVRNCQTDRGGFCYDDKDDFCGVESYSCGELTLDLNAMCSNSNYTDVLAALVSLPAGAVSS